MIIESFNDIYLDNHQIFLQLQVCIKEQTDDQSNVYRADTPCDMIQLTKEQIPPILYIDKIYNYEDFNSSASVKYITYIIRIKCSETLSFTILSTSENIIRQTFKWILNDEDITLEKLKLKFPELFV